MFYLKTRICWKVYGKTLDESNDNHLLWPLELFDHMKKAKRFTKNAGLHLQRKCTNESSSMKPVTDDREG